MTVTRRHAGWLVIVFFFGLVAVVFQQILTNMAEQGITSGGPYDDAAAYPQAVAILIAVMVVLQIIVQRFQRAAAPDLTGYSLAALRRPALLLLIFAVYLFLLGNLGYQLATPLMIIAVMVLSGMRRPLEIIAAGVVISVVLAFFFEVFLNIVLPGGVFDLHIPF